jgi:hypothetical protein
VKVHGDYLDTRIRNTEAELEVYSSAQNSLLDRVFDEHGLIICGWSGEWDPALRSAIARAPTRRYPLFWASRAEPSGLGADLLSHRGGRWVAIDDADSFFHDLQRKTEIQLSLNRSHPLSVNLLVAGAKRYVARDETRVELSDLVLNETRAAQAKISQSDISGQVRGHPSDAAEFRRRIVGFESAIEPLTAVFGVLGRWGVGGEASLAATILREFTAHTPRNGYKLWDSLRSYPAILIWYGYGVCAAKAERYEALLRWLTQPVKRDRDDRLEPAAKALFLSNWSGFSEGAWSSLDGAVPGRHVHSDYLRARLRALVGGEFVSEGEFDRTFERFELLASLVDISASIDKDRLQALVANSRDQLFVPVGRMAVSDRESVTAMTDLREPDLKGRLVQVGFARGDPQFFDLALDGLDRQAGLSRFR